MTLSNLATLVFVAAIALFATSLFARRVGNNNPALQSAVKALRVIVLGLVAFYFYKRFAG